MKTMRRIVPSAGKMKKQRERIRETQVAIDALIEDMKQMPPAERQEIVDLFSALFVREKNG